MKTSRFLFAILLSSICFSDFAQIPQPAQPRDYSSRKPIDKVVLRVTYSNLTRQVIHEESYASDRQILEVGEKYSRFYSSYAELEDSLFTYYGQFGLRTDKDGHREQGTYEDIYFDYPNKGKMSVYTRYLKNTYVYTEDNPKPVWKLLPETKEILGYTCQKARTEYLGRTWYAWFTSEIPLHCGPWKLWGLPGLILSVQDADRYFIYEAVEVSQERSGSMMKYEGMESECKRKDIMRLNDLRWQDSGLLLRIVSGKETLVMNPGDSRKAVQRNNVGIVIPQKELK